MQSNAYLLQKILAGASWEKLHLVSAVFTVDSAEEVASILTVGKRLARAFSICSKHLQTPHIDSHCVVFYQHLGHRCFTHSTGVPAPPHFSLPNTLTSVHNCSGASNFLSIISCKCGPVRKEILRRISEFVYVWKKSAISDKKCIHWRDVI